VVFPTVLKIAQTRNELKTLHFMCPRWRRHQQRHKKKKSRGRFAPKTTPDKRKGRKAKQKRGAEVRGRFITSKSVASAHSLAPLSLAGGGKAFVIVVRFLLSGGASLETRR